jgi:hypothetical protein
VKPFGGYLDGPRSGVGDSNNGHTSAGAPLGERGGEVRRVLAIAVVLVSAFAASTAGRALADPLNNNTQTRFATCEGIGSVTVVFVGGAAAHVTDGTSVWVLMGLQKNGVWVGPISTGMEKRDLTVCNYSVGSDLYTLYVKLSPREGSGK